MTHLNAPAAAGDIRFLLAPVIARTSIWSALAQSFGARHPASIARLSEHQRRDIGYEADLG